MPPLETRFGCVSVALDHTAFARSAAGGYNGSEPDPTNSRTPQPALRRENRHDKERTLAPALRTFGVALTARSSARGRARIGSASDSLRYLFWLLPVRPNHVKQRTSPGRREMDARQDTPQLISLTLTEFADALGSDQTAPGGGSAAALAGALGGAAGSDGRQADVGPREICDAPG